MVFQETSKTGTSHVKQKRANFFSSRSLRQLGIFVVGAGCFAASMAITRRSIARKYQRSIPKFFQTSFPNNTEINGAMEALEALNLATINVFSVGMMGIGGILWAFDISSTDDMKKRIQKNMMQGSNVKSEISDADIEEWFASILARKEFKAFRSENGITDEQLQLRIRNSHPK